MNRFSDLDHIRQHMGLSYCILKDEVVVPVPHSERAVWSEYRRRNNEHIIGQDLINDDILLSTIFIGLPNVLFETMVFQKWEEDDSYPSSELIDRPLTYAEAIKVHQQALVALKKEPNLFFTLSPWRFEAS